MTDIAVEHCGRIGYLTLRREGTLNPLTLPMIQQLDAGMQSHQDNPRIDAIVIRSAHPKAFCAGGDMKLIREWVLAERHDEVAQFFQEEYALNLHIAQCRKPWISLIDGIVMGGGLGLTMHGTYQVVSERALLAMPESRIGFFPDVGASYFLPRLPHNAGYWLAYTAMAVQAGDAVQTGLATHYIESDQWPSMIVALEETDGAPVEQILDDYVQTSSTNKNPDIHARAQWFTDHNVQSIKANLTAAADTSADAAHLLQQLCAASPHSLSVTQSVFEQAAGNNLENCLLLEATAAASASQHADFIEGVRAVLVDKDRNPQWLTPA